MLCQRCGKEMYENSACPECGAVRKLPLSGCLEPDTFYDIRNIKKAVPAQANAAPDGRPKPKAVHREWDIAVPVLNPPANGRAASADKEFSKAGTFVTAAMITLALAMCLVNVIVNIMG